MGTPQLENGYTRIADEIMEALIRYRIPGEQMQCLLLIIRKTYGFNKVWDPISNSQFVEFTGLKKPSVCRAVNALIGKNVVIKKANTYIPTYCFNKNYKKWKVLAKKITVSKKVIPVLAKKLPTIDNITIDNNGHFKIFYAAYPKKKSKGQAETTWNKLSKKKILPEVQVLLTAIEKQKKSKDWQDKQFIPYPSTWLNAHGWEDETETYETRRIYDE